MMSVATVSPGMPIRGATAASTGGAVLSLELTDLGDHSCDIGGSVLNPAG